MSVFDFNLGSDWAASLVCNSSSVVSTIAPDGYEVVLQV